MGQRLLPTIAEQPVTLFSVALEVSFLIKHTKLKIPERHKVFIPGTTYKDIAKLNLNQMSIHYGAKM